MNEDIVIWEIGNVVRTSDPFCNYEIIELNEYDLTLKVVGSNEIYKGIKYNEIY